MVGVVLVEGELGVAIYSRPMAVPANGITPTKTMARQWVVRWFRWLGISVVIHWFHSDANLG